ncbi:MAG TPA: hypothetical protein VGJ70_04655, partial [Solirubrobacteraceae bacterium]
EAYRNGLEDVDLCLRLRRAGWEVHYCPRCVVVHLESISRRARVAEQRRGAELFRARWGAELHRDDVETYVRDGLLRLRYRPTYPLGLEASPQLALVEGTGADDRDRLLAARTQEVAELLQENIRLTARLHEVELGRPARPRAGHPADALLAMQEELAARSGFPASEALRYRALRRRLTAAVRAATPEGATLAVVSRGDDELLAVGARRAWHFPRDDDGAWAGHYPADSDEAIAQLEAVRRDGADYLVVPSTAAWWLDEYPGLRAHLRRRGRAVPCDDDVCRVFRLGAR